MSTPTWKSIANKYIYNKDFTENCIIAKQYPDCLIPYSVLCAQEGYRSNNLSDCKVVYLDAVARKENPHNNPSSMDFLHGLKQRENDSTEKSPKGQKIIFSECRFNYRNVTNIKRKDLEDKIKETRSLVSSDIQHVLNSYVFIFSDDVINQAVSHLQRIMPNMSWIAVTAKEYDAVFK